MMDIIIIPSLDRETFKLTRIRRLQFHCGRSNPERINPVHDSNDDDRSRMRKARRNGRANLTEASQPRAFLRIIVRDISGSFKAHGIVKIVAS